MIEINIYDQTEIHFKDGDTLTLKPLETSSIWVNPEEVRFIVVKGPKQDRM